MSQASLLPVICDRTKPPPATADADCIAIESATERRFLCKSARHEKFLPATEWICASLARACGIIVADWTVVQLAGQSEKMFGSIWEGGSRDPLSSLPKVTNPKLFSQALAIDFATHNVDRHLANYLYIELAGDVVVKLIDSSRALLHHGWPLPPLPMDRAEKTVQCAAFWQRYHSYDLSSAMSVTSKIAELPSNWMTETIASMPGEWLDGAAADALAEWWCSERISRVNRVESLLS